LLISFLVVFLCFSCLEIYFRFFFIRSDGFGITLSSQRWFKRYWYPINSFGYRDNEWTKNNLENKTKVIVVGDSFVAGHGIENIADRFSGVLAQNLGPAYAVITVAGNGWGTRTELMQLKNYPHKADIVIWSYFPNDIEEAASRLNQGFKFPTPAAGIVKNITSKSYFLDYIYWLLVRFKLNNASTNYIQWVNKQYADPQVWNLHKEELALVCKSMGVNLIVVIFPFLQDVDGSKFIVTKVKNVFEGCGVKVVEVSDLVSNLSKNEVTINKLDAHPGKKVHELLGNSLYKLVLQM